MPKYKHEHTFDETQTFNFMSSNAGSYGDGFYVDVWICKCRALKIGEKVYKSEKPDQWIKKGV